ncbi:MAG TPA: hypothetical protein VJ021_00805 [Thermoplasmata archaeon]|nr:hypothetical protein [Thermoplasmata archaeon]
MTSTTVGRGCALPRPPNTWVGVGAITLAVSLLILLSPAVTAATPTTSWGIAPSSWSNGIVLCEFSSGVPTVGVSALSRADTGVSATLGSISEVTPEGNLVATAALPSNSWTATNFSTNDAYDLGYTVHAPVTGSSAPYPVLGGVDARVDFDLPIYAGSPSGPADTVAIELLMSNWSWQAPGDHLVVTLTLWPSFANEEHLVLGSSPESLVSSASTTSGTTFEQMAASTSAVANAGLPSATNISATPSASGNSSLGVVAVTFGAAAGEFTSLSYTASVRVLFPATIAGIPTVDLVAVGGVAALIALLVAAGARQVRRRPSDLTYVDEEKP